jgi:O-antigen ligase
MMAGALAFTSSRGGYLGLVVSLAILATGAAPHGLWGRARESLRRAVNLLVILLAATVILVAVLPGARTAAAGLWRGVASVGDILQEKSARRHLETWLVAVHITLDHPLFGAGPDTYAVLFPRYKEVVLPRHRARVFAPYRVESPHDVYLAIAAGAGLPALAAYGILVGAVASALLRAARRAEREKQVALFGLLAAMGGHVVTDSFMTADLTGSWLFWLLMGAGLAFARTESPPESAAQAEGRSAAAGGST